MVISDSSCGAPNINTSRFAMAPVFEHVHNKRLRKQNAMSLLTSKCFPSIYNLGLLWGIPYLLDYI